MSDNSAKILELMQIGFSVSIDATKYEEDIEEIKELLEKRLLITQHLILYLTLFMGLVWTEM